MKQITIFEFFIFAKTKPIFDQWLCFLFVHIKSYNNLINKQLNDITFKKIKKHRMKQYEEDFYFIFEEINIILKKINKNVICNIDDFLFFYSFHKNEINIYLESIKIK